MKTPSILTINYSRGRCGKTKCCKCVHYNSKQCANAMSSLVSGITLTLMFLLPPCIFIVNYHVLIPIFWGISVEVRLRMEFQALEIQYIVVLNRDIESFYFVQVFYSNFMCIRVDNSITTAGFSLMCRMTKRDQVFYYMHFYCFKSVIL